MRERGGGRRGQSIATEYVVIFFCAITAIALMSLYVRRTLNARVRDAQYFALKQAARALQNEIPREYEPYYAQVVTDKDETVADRDWCRGKVCGKDFNQRRIIRSRTEQKPPMEAK